MYVCTYTYISCSEMDEMKSVLVEALLLEVRSICMYVAGLFYALDIIHTQGAVICKSEEDLLSRLTEIYVDLHKLLEQKDEKVWNDL